VFKIVLLGDAGSGKSSLRSHFLYNTFSQSYTRTTTPDFIATYVSLDSTLTAVQLWDTDGSARDLTVATSLCMDADGIALVYDASNASSLYALERHAALVNRVVSSQARPVPVLLVQNKSDCSSEVGEKEAMDFCACLPG
ncbi:P-loop containing nucleoside triphosphate hydrolase protein, partial [Linderina pennispora]